MSSARSNAASSFFEVGCVCGLALLNLAAASSGDRSGSPKAFRVATPGDNIDRRLTKAGGGTRGDSSSIEGGKAGLYITESLVGSKALCNATSSAGDAVCQNKELVGSSVES